VKILNLEKPRREEELHYIILWLQDVESTEFGFSRFPSSSLGEEVYLFSIELLYCKPLMWVRSARFTRCKAAINGVDLLGLHTEEHVTIHN